MILQAVQAYHRQQATSASTNHFQQGKHRFCKIFTVTAPPFPPPEAGQCHFSTESGREICWPRYEDLDTTCTDVGSGMVSAPAVKHAALVYIVIFIFMLNLLRKNRITPINYLSVSTSLFSVKKILSSLKNQSHENDLLIHTNVVAINQ